jgi:hypothetical protein
MNIFLRIVGSINTEVMRDNRIFIRCASVYSVYEYSSINISLFCIIHELHSSVVPD